MWSIPWFSFPPIDFGFIGLGKLYWFSIFVMIGIVTGVLWLDRISLRGGSVKPEIARQIPEIAVISGFIGAHFMHVLAYHPEMLQEDPWALFKIWNGISSIGGFLGGTLGVMVYFRIKKEGLIPYADRIVFGMVLAWIFGRLGCATAHDHPGSLTTFFMGLEFPDGVRHDLGLYEFLYTLFVLTPLVFFLSRKQHRAGTLTGWVLVTYAPMRFLWDFLRAQDMDYVDARYLGLTPAQYGVLAMLLTGAAILWRSHREKWAIQPALWGKHAQPLPEKTEKAKKNGSSAEEADKN